jgi:hypothetical protein
VVELVGGVAVAVKPDVPARLAFGFDQPSLVGLNISEIRTGAQTGRVVIVVIVDGFDALLKLRVI